MKLVLIPLILIITQFAYAQKSCEDTSIKVMVIDTGITPTKYTRKYIAESTVSENYHDVNGHGSHIAGIVIDGNLEKGSVPVCDNVKLYSCKYFYPGEKVELDETIKCFNKAIELKVDFINYSSTGPDPDPSEQAVIQKASDLGIIIIASAGNESKNRLGYPAGYDIENLIAVGNMNYKGEISPYSNYTGGIVYDYGTDILSNDQYGIPLKMSGTSQAAAMYTHRLLLKKCNKMQKETINTLKSKDTSDIVSINGGSNGKSSSRNTSIRFDWTGRLISESDF